MSSKFLVSDFYRGVLGFVACLRLFKINFFVLIIFIGEFMEFLIESKPMNKWDVRFCELAKHVSQWSKDPNAQVGAALFSKKVAIYL